MSDSKLNEEKQNLMQYNDLVFPSAESEFSSYNLGAVSCEEDPKIFTTKEVIDYLGFGKAQVISCSILALSFIGGFGAIQLQPFLSARLYVEMQLSPFSEALLGLISLGGLLFAGLTMGVISDKIGRKNTTILTCFLMTFWDLLACLSSSFIWIVICRLLVSMSRGT